VHRAVLYGSVVVEFYRKFSDVSTWARVEDYPGYIKEYKPPEYKIVWGPEPYVPPINYEYYLICNIWINDKKIVGIYYPLFEDGDLF
jgi:predicted nucleotidyltransferase